MVTSEYDPYSLVGLQDHVKEGPEKDATDGCDDAGSALLQEKARRVSLIPSAQIPKVTDVQEDIAKKLQSMSQRARYVRLAIFVAIEFAWLGFVLSCHFHVIKTGSDNETVRLPGGITITRDALVKSGLATIGIVIQLVALLPVAEIIVEVYSGEWSHILFVERGCLSRMTDRVSTLTSTFKDRSLHFLDKRSSMRYRIAFAAGFLSVLLQAIAPGALSSTSDIISTEMELTIGGLEPGRTNDTLPVTSDGTGANVNTLLARNLLLEAARYEYVTWIQNSTVDFILNTNALLYGMPPRELLRTNSHLRYTSGAVYFQFTCQWLAPTYLGGSLLSSNWSFGGDMQATVDFNAIPSTADPREVTGIWPVMITSGAGSRNGSLAWLILGGGSDLTHGVTHMPIYLANTTSQRTFNSSGWTDILPNITVNAPELSSDATVLFCDPHMRMVPVSVTLQGQQLHADIQGGASIGNLDWDETSRMLGRSLNGMPWDSVLYRRLGVSLYYSSLTELAVNIILVQEPGLPFSPRPLPDITSSIQSYVAVAGASAYLDGSVGNATVMAENFRSIQRLVCSWPQWSVSVALFVLIFFLLVGIVLLETVKKGNLVPLTLASAVAAVDATNSGSPHDGYDQKDYARESKMQEEAA